MWRLVTLALVIAGCYRVEALSSGDAGDTSDADAAFVEIDAAPGETCYGADDKLAGIVRVCIPTPTASATLRASIDTDPTPCPITKTTTGEQVCVVSGTTVTIGGIRVQGAFPLVVIASVSLVVDAPVDASGSRVGAAPGPGAQVGCAGHAGVDDDGSGAGGGAGGSYAGFGGTGGDASAGTGGMANVPDLTDTLRGGCAGGDGGKSSGMGAGAGGFAGGAIALISPVITIEATGVVLAHGGGGITGTTGNAGGGGGGAGGMIVLESPHSITFAAGSKLLADGGGGGQGADGGVVGFSGGEVDLNNPTQRAAGGANTNASGGAGGASSGAGGATAIGQAGKPPKGVPGGGGGGGGGAGAIRVFPAGTGSAVVSPPAS